MKASNWLAMGAIAVLLCGIVWMVLGMKESFVEAKEARPPMSMASPSAPIGPRAVRIRPRPAVKRRVIDSAMKPSKATGTGRFPSAVVAKMEVVTVDYLGFDGHDHQGQIVVDKRLAKEVKDIFADLRKIRYPIEKVVPVAHYGWDDVRSMKDNNTSAFNYRQQVMPSGRSGYGLSKHSLGRAIDLNPRINPYVGKNGKSVYPYKPSAKGALTKQSQAVSIFARRGWQWGGNWPGAKDYQHFVKP